MEKYIEWVEAYKKHEMEANAQLPLDNQENNNENMIKLIQGIEENILRPYIKKNIYIKKCPLSVFFGQLICILEGEYDGIPVIRDEDISKCLPNFDDVQFDKIPKLYKLKRQDKRLLHEWNELKYIPKYIARFMAKNHINVFNKYSGMAVFSEVEKFKPVINKSEAE